jgi:hypothetical protein
VDALFKRLDEAMAKKTRGPATISTELITVMDTLGNNFKIEYGDPEAEIAAAMALQANAAGLIQAAPPAATSAALGPASAGPPQAATPLLSELSKTYLRLKEERSGLAQGTITEYATAHQELVFILEDRPVADPRNEDAESLYDALLRLPKNRKAYPKYTGRTAAALLLDDIPTAERREAGSANKIFDLQAFLGVDKRVVGTSRGKAVRTTVPDRSLPCPTERLAEAGTEPSVGSRGDSYDNALAETINGLYKAELIHRRSPWKSRESVELATLEWVAWYNHERLMQPLGYIPPAEAEANYYRQLASQAAKAA